MVKFYFHYNIYIYIYTHIYIRNGTSVLTSIEIYCSTSQTGTSSGTKLTSLAIYNV